MSRSDIRINGGFFVFQREILDLIEPGDELVEETFARLIAERRAGRVSVRRLLRRRWTRSRTGSASRRCTSRARRRGSTCRLDGVPV